MTADKPENKLTVSVANTDEFKALCEKTEATMKSLRELIQQINEFELEIVVK